MPQMPELLERPLDTFDRHELSLLAGAMRIDPPKIRELIEWMDDQGINSLADTDRDVLIEKARGLGFSVYADPLDVLKGSTVPKSDDAA